ncbi:hypothetical protein NDU88_006091 [Pleurodeles waltl]|uniref:Uncharacterized protein n=1 Tax=Pleurodeles waltl TaxID=8319 RepID=A0AAV7QH33_PLEWA|nr:hypothetical protein NDU88_006091 [Pleurodeles waltl]
MGTAGRCETCSRVFAEITVSWLQSQGMLAQPLELEHAPTCLHFLIKVAEVRALRTNVRHAAVSGYNHIMCRCVFRSMRLYESKLMG